MHYQYRYIPLIMMTASLLIVAALGLSLPQGPISASTNQGIIYVDVDANPGGNGDSWNTAYKHLQDALDETNADGASHYEIWVAEGIYYPDRDDDGDHVTGVVSETFRLNYNNVQLFGGFAGGEDELTQRDWQANLTVLSGDIDSNDTTDTHGVVIDTSDINGENAHHVLYLDGITNEPITTTTTIDGFTITAGHARDTGTSIGADDGGGLLCRGGGSGHACSPTLTNLNFSGNLAEDDGGALYNYGQGGGASSPILTQVAFSGNAANGAGGAVYNNGAWAGYSNPLLTDVTFSDNQAAASGGAMYNYAYNGGRSHPVLTDITFTNNLAGNDGGAIYSFAEHGYSNPKLENVTFIGNQASGSEYGSDGGAMYNNADQDGSSSPTLTNVTFIGNSAENDGGAIFTNAMFSGYSRLRLTNVTFIGNSANSTGGAISSTGYTDGRNYPTLVNVVFSRNTASFGGAMYNDSNRGICYATLTNVTFSGNSATKGGAMYNTAPFENTTIDPSLINVIMWGNTADTGAQIYNHSESINISYSTVEGGVDGDGIYFDAVAGGVVNDLGGNFNEDPLFVDSANDDLHLQSTSPAIDTGDNDSVPAEITTDLDGDPRIVDYPPQGGTGNGTSPFVDMGAYEKQEKITFEVYLPLAIND
jgi:predicted outer membrane repeat protein